MEGGTAAAPRLFLEARRRTRAETGEAAALSMSVRLRSTIMVNTGDPSYVFFVEFPLVFVLCVTAERGVASVHGMR